MRLNDTDSAQGDAFLGVLISRATAILALVFTAPLFVAVAAVNWLATRRVLFRQVRVGRDLAPFVVLKFQTMVDDAAHGSSVTVAHDPRITRIGRVLRLLKLDELPQLVNIARGEMRFVGPRPLTPNEVAALPRALAEEVYRVAPGLTGISALAFANEERRLLGAADPERAYANEILPRKIALELAYARQRTWLSDLTIAAVTPLAPFSAWVRRAVLRWLVPSGDALETDASVPPGARIYLSPPHVGAEECTLVRDALASNWVAPLGPHVEAFEKEFAATVRAGYAVALSSGTAALHLALLASGVGPGDEVAVSSFTFVASANPVRYVGATPVFIDSEASSWNMDPALLAQWVRDRARRGRLPRAVILVHLYGQSADIDAVHDTCREYGVELHEDAAEALGATYKGRHPGTAGLTGAFSFNGNKIITTSGGGMLVTGDANLARRVRKLATQAREAAPHYEHCEVGYNYRLSNICAAIGRAQLARLEERVAARRAVFERYRQGLADLPGLSFAPEAPWGRHTRWLTCILVEPREFGCDREAIRLALEAQNIEARPLWKPMHLQPLYAGCEVVGGAVSAHLFERGLCLPSGSNLSPADQDRVIEIIRRLHRL